MRVWIDLRTTNEHAPALEAWISSLGYAWDFNGGGPGETQWYLDWDEGDEMLVAAGLGLAGPLPTAPVPCELVATFEGCDEGGTDGMRGYIWEPETQTLTGAEIVGGAPYTRVTLDADGNLYASPADTDEAVAYLRAMQRIGLALPKV